MVEKNARVTDDSRRRDVRSRSLWYENVPRCYLHLPLKSQEISCDHKLTSVIKQVSEFTSPILGQG